MKTSDVLSNRTTVKSVSGKDWRSATSVRRSIQDALLEASRTFERNDRLRMSCPPAVLTTIMRTQEVADGMFFLKDIPNEWRPNLEKYGLPHKLYGVELNAVEEGDLPDSWVVIDCPDRPERVVVVTDVN